MNLLPNYGNGPPWENYSQYLDFYIETYKPQLLCFDHCESINHTSHLPVCCGILARQLLAVVVWTYV